MKKLFLSLTFILTVLVINAQSDTLQQYTGVYVFPEGSVVPSVDVKLDNGALSMSSAAGNSSLVQLGIDSFSIVEFSGTAIFRRSDDKKINGVYIDAAGYILEGKKTANGIWIFREYYRAIKNEELLAQ